MGHRRFITTGGSGYIKPLNINPPTYKNIDMPKSIEEARLRMYNQISPVWGFTDDTLNAFFDTMLHNTNNFVNSDDKPVTISDPYIDGVWAEYLQIPRNLRRSKYRLQPSKYRPTVGDENVEYYTIPIEDGSKRELVQFGQQIPLGTNRLSTILMGYNHGEHTVGNGVDPKKGQYISYYDRWDLNPLSSRYSAESKFSNNPIIKKLGLLDNRKYGDLSLGLGKPIDFYDRIYLDDYYGVDSSAKPGTYYGGWLPELIVTNNGFGTTTNEMGNITKFGIPTEKASKIKPRKQ